MVNFNNPKVSVIIPTYNCGDYIEEAIASILSQTYTDYEIIVVDDGSTDETKNVLKPYAESIRYFYQDNKGVSVARNLGIAKSKGEYIAFLDADDYFILPTKLSEQVACFQTQPDIGIVHSGWQVVDENGNKILDKAMWKEVPILDLEGWLRNMCVRPSSMMFAKKWLEKTNGFDSQFHQAEDLKLTFELILMGCKCIWLPKITVAYRQRSTSLTANPKARINSLDDFLNWFFKRSNLPQKIVNLEKEIYNNMQIWFAWYCYKTGQFSMMVKYLNKALDNSDYPAIVNVDIWLNSFKQTHLNETGEELNVSNLINLPQWQQLIKDIFIKQFHKQ